MKAHQPLASYFTVDCIEAGCDEAGRGCLAGPVFAAAVILPADFSSPLLNDSKQLTEHQRYALRPIIENQALAWSVAQVSAAEIDKINILNATKKGLTIAIRQMEEKLEEKNIKKPDVILVDALTGIDTLGIPYKSIIHGDAISYSIACASIIAKVTRDRIMRKMDEMYPQYGFAKHKGYGTAAHMQAIRENGLCPLHRRSFVKNII